MPTDNLESQGVGVNTEKALENVAKTILKEVPAVGRNFEIETTGSENLILSKNGEIVDLSSFLPPGVTFSKLDYFGYDTKQKKVFYPEDEIPLRGFLLSLSHEIGHANGKTEHIPSRWDSIKAVLEGIVKFSKDIKAPTHLTILECTPTWYLDKLTANQASLERNAWAFGLSALRSLESKGFNVFAGFNGSEEIQRYINLCLFIYDNNFARRKEIASTRGDKPFEYHSPFIRIPLLRHRGAISEPKIDEVLPVSVKNHSGS